jgi:hypothetical protein
MVSVIEQSYTVESETLDSVFTHWQRADSFLTWNCLFVLPVWLKAWWDNFGRNSALYLLSIRHEGRIIGIAPLQRSDDTVRLIGDENVCDGIGAGSSGFVCHAAVIAGSGEDRLQDFI